MNFKLALLAAGCLFILGRVIVDEVGKIRRSLKGWRVEKIAWWTLIEGWVGKEEKKIERWSTSLLHHHLH
jgi:hypothetical protein